MHAASTRHLNRPLVTIVVVCRNQAPYVVECLESIRQQTYDNIELIIVDDCSQDDSVSTISEWLETTGVRATSLRIYARCSRRARPSRSFSTATTRSGKRLR